ncbi:MAG: FkbM family methyltransferase [Candidatus Nanoarchaeia archaeon]|nr:FkbM family methyltransferase [Candidatus Nanoarchaeia archaeon]
MRLSVEYHYEHDGIKLASAGLNLDILNQYIKNPKVIIEFGSFDGGDGLRYKLAYPNCDIYSIESDPILFERIKKLEKYGLGVFNYAIYHKTGDIKFNRCRFKEPYYCYNKNDIGGSGSILEPSDYNKKIVTHQEYDEKAIMVPSITIQQFCLEHNINVIDLMHIDVEGATLEVLEGFGEIRPKVLFIEIEGAVKFWEGAPELKLVDFILNKMGYELKEKDEVNALYVKKEVD